jgi:transposase-like protein
MPIDNNSNTNNNSSIDDNNDDYVVVKRENLKNLLDPDCKHYFVKDNDEIDEDSQSWKCNKCHRGTFLPKHVNIINS